MVASNHHLSVSWWFRLNLVGSVSAVISTGSADQWDDFTNNFATDLAPIIVLFGEQVTKQFLSESTGLLDNIIFGVAPLGILTAVVSVIRVYGNASLKAFIGRAQEAHGQAEAELCSSTSNDVCELWSNGGICRVFGRPWILEFCYTGSKTLFYPIFDDRDGVNLRPGVSGIYLPKDALCGSQDGKVHAEKDDLVSSDDSVNLSAWSEINSKLKSKMDSGTGFEGVSIRIAASAEEGRTMQFAPHPNLSLNIGIKSVGKPLSFLMAVIGMLLQSGFFSYSTWITFYYPQLYNNSEPPHLWSFVLATAGTAMLVVGMTLSARIIEMRSIERSFEERPNEKESTTTMFWLQPGGQRIGDQLFDAFAYAENKATYITSWKAEASKAPADGFKLFNRDTFTFWTAILSASLGFISQFIGFRGLHGSVALYQLAITLFMAIIRAALRSRRLSRDSNCLEGFGRDIEGYELDWQALNIEHVARNQRDRMSIERYGKFGWFLNDSPHPIGSPPGETVAPQVANGSDPRARNCIVGFHVKKEFNESERDSGRPNDAARLMLYRSRLAYLTSDALRLPEQRWDTPLRRITTALQQAIQESAEYIFANMKFESQGWRDAYALIWSTAITCQRYKASEEPQLGRSAGLNPSLPVHFIMFRRGGRWEISKWQLEAVLGLWAWSLKSCKQQADAGRLKKVFALVGKSEKSDFRAAIRLWVTRLHDIAEDPVELCPSSPLYGAGSVEGHQVASNLPFLTTLTNPLVMALDPQPRNPQTPPLDQPGKELLLWIETRSSTLQLLAQDIFSIFISRIADIVDPLDDVQTWSIDSQGRQYPFGRNSVDNSCVTNVHISSIADIFVSAGLGSREDALFSIIPPLLRRGKLPSLTTVAQTPLSNARQMRRDSQYSRAEKMLRGLADAMPGQFQEQAVYSLCQLYRKALRSQDPWERIYGRIALEPITWSSLLGSDQTLQKTHIQQTLDHYKSVWKFYSNPQSRSILRLADILYDVISGPVLPRGLLLSSEVVLSRSSTDQVMKVLSWAIEGNCIELIEDLWDDTRKLINVTCIGSNRESASPLFIAIKADCAIETFEALLGWPGVDVEIRDLKQRTPLAAASEEGNTKIVHLLLQKGADTEAKDRERQTPLLKALSKHHDEVVKELLSAGADIHEPRSISGGTALHLSLDCSFEVIELLLRRGADVNAWDATGRRPLVAAVEMGNVDAVDALLNNGAQLECSNDNFLPFDANPLRLAVSDNKKVMAERLLQAYSKTGSPIDDRVLFLAVSSSYEEIVHHLLKYGANVDIQDSSGSTPLFNAIRQGNRNIATQLLEAGARTDLGPSDARGTRSPFCAAVEDKSTSFVQLLLEYKGRPSTEDIRVAAESGNYNLVSSLLAARPELLSEDHVYSVLLQTATEEWHGREGELEVIKQLIKARSDVTGKRIENGEPYCNALQAASHRGREDIVDVLLQAGADLNMIGGEYGTALHAAVAGWDDDIMVEMLLGNGGMADAQGGMHGTALHAAIYHGRQRTFNILLGSGPDFEARDRNMHTPLLATVAYNRPQMARALLEAGVDIEAKDELACTPLLVVVSKGLEDITRLLLKHGANVEAQDAKGRTAFLLAIDEHHETIIEVLLNADNKSNVNVLGGIYGSPLKAAMYWGDQTLQMKLLQAGAKQPAGHSDEDIDKDSYEDSDW